MSTREFEPVVLKFGGTSVATRERWERIAGIVRERRESGEHPLLVCSAVAEVSDALEEALRQTRSDEWRGALDSIVERHRGLADELGVAVPPKVGETFEELERLLRGASLVEEVSPRLRARVMSAGELVATRLGAAFLESRGLTTGWLDARDVLESDAEPTVDARRRYLSATCGFERDNDLRERLIEDDVGAHLTQGFIARDSDGSTVLLGRGGSDTSAACLAGKIGAGRVEIWTDVHGLFTANPAQVPSARLLKELDYEEAQELATMGAEVLHPRCIDPVREHSIPLHVRCIGAPEQSGTRISSDPPDAGPQVKAISAKRDVSLVSMETLGMWQEVGFLADAFECFAENGLSIDLVATSETNVTVSLDPTANALESDRVERLLTALDDHCDASEIGPCGAVSLVGRQIRSILDELGPALEVFDEQRVHLVSQAASDLNFTFVVDEDQTERLVRELHSLLFGDRREDRLLGPTWRELTGETPQGPQLEHRWWAERREELLAIAADEGPTFVYERRRLKRAARELGDLRGVDRRFYAMKANPNPEILRIFEGAGLGFECVSPGEVRRLLELFPDLERDRILFTPNFAPREEYAFGFDRDVWVTVDNVEPLRRWPDLFRGETIFLRVDPGRGRGHHEFVRTAGVQSKFGIAPPQLEEAARVAGELGLEVAGLHAHLGSGIKDPSAWAEAGMFLAECAQAFGGVRVLDVGGGLGVPEGADRAELDLEAVSERLEAFSEAHPEFEVWLEPGRFLVADAGVLVARVTQTKQKGAVEYVGLETGMNSLIRPALYGAYHEIANLSRLGESRTTRAEVVGPICESGDVLGHGRRLPETEEGDVVLIDRTGAYGRAMSSRYNLREPAGETLL